MPGPPPAPHVLFVDIENAGRSRMAEAWLRALGEGRVGASSAGTRPGPASPAAVAAMADAGVDISAARPHGLDAVDLGSVTHVITVCDEAAAALPPLPREVERRHWSVPDPAGLKADFPHLVDQGFAAIRDNLRDRVRLLLMELGQAPADAVDMRGGGA
jgi:protein-tyrosine-phosphatase